MEPDARTSRAAAALGSKLSSLEVFACRLAEAAVPQRPRASSRQR